MGLVCKFNKSLYDTMQAARQWYKEIDINLQELGYNRSFAHSGQYLRGTREDRVLLAIYVDDITVVEKQLRKVKEAKAELSGRYNIHSRITHGEQG